jgi:MFS transporter, MFS domain-containing protein family, molybdate-anion transporter
MIFGSFIGGMADWGGRRRFVILFSIIYAASCMTKHFKDFNVLMLGRLLGGVATSLLFSVFDAWLIRSHSDAKLGKQFLGQSFSAAAYGNSIIAIGAGLVANKAAASTTMEIFPQEPIYFGGYLNPFDIALGALILCGILATILWDENYGEEEKHETGEVGVDKNSDDGRSAPNWYDGLKNAFVVTMRSQDILLCGIISSLFEGSMYIFVFMWTPALSALTAGEAKLPFGLIFSTFMVSCMCGSSLFSVLIGKFKGEQLGVGVFAVASTSMAMIAMGGTDTISFVAMLLFEMCVGMYWPIMGTMKGYIVPEDKRAAIYNLYRIPLNFIVLFSLLTDLTPTQSFTLNGAMLATATILQAILMKRRLLMQGIGDKSLTSDEEIAPLKLDEGKSENV